MLAHHSLASPPSCLIHQPAPLLSPLPLVILLSSPPHQLCFCTSFLRAQGMADGLQLLVRAYTLDPSNVGTLVMLAHYCLIKGEYDKVGGCGRACTNGCASIR